MKTKTETLKRKKKKVLREERERRWQVIFLLDQLVLPFSFALALSAP